MSRPAAIRPPLPRRRRARDAPLARGARGALIVLAGLALGAGLASAVAAQGLGLRSDSDEPLEINADEGIEWRQEEGVYIARGNASAVRGGVTVRGDTLTAHYRDSSQGGTDIWRIDAAGHVTISSQSAVASGDNGVYDVVNGILVLKGRDLRLETETYTVTARDSLEYWEPQQMAVARGNAIVVSEDRRLEADVVTAHFQEAPAADGAGAGGEGSPETKLERIEAFGDVHVSTGNQVARGDRGVYDVESGIATLYGSVKITRGQDQLNGEYGEIDLNTGVSRLLAGPPGAEGTKRVRALFSSRKKPEIEARQEGGEAKAAP